MKVCRKSIDYGKYEWYTVLDDRKRNLSDKITHNFPPYIKNCAIQKVAHFFYYFAFLLVILFLATRSFLIFFVDFWR